MLTDCKRPTRPTEACPHTNTQPGTRYLTPMCTHTGTQADVGASHPHAHTQMGGLTLTHSANVFWVPTTWSRLGPHQGIHHTNAGSETRDPSSQREHLGHLQGPGSAALPGDVWAIKIRAASREGANIELHSLPNRVAQLGAIPKGHWDIPGGTHDCWTCPNTTKECLLHVVEKRIWQAA